MEYECEAIQKTSFTGKSMIYVGLRITSSREAAYEAKRSNITFAFFIH
jgi:hypothetical protein